MAAVPITIVGILSHDDGTSENVSIVGVSSITGLTVGGGPIIPPVSPGVPTHPIWGPPGFNPPGPGMPPGIWGGPIPPMPDTPPDGGIKPPPPDGGWGYHPEYGWGYFPGGGGKPQPPSAKQ